MHLCAVLELTLLQEGLQSLRIELDARYTELFYVGPLQDVQHDRIIHILQTLEY